MGTTCCCVNSLGSLKISDLVTLLGILINSGLAIWIVRTIQSRITNQRVLKDHFINEIKQIRNDYKTFLNSLYANKTRPQSIIPWFKLMNIKVSDLIELIHPIYKINKSILKPYQDDLRELITNNVDFILQFKSDNPISFSETSRNSIIKFQQDHNKIFNNIIVEINDSNSYNN